jgi:hypothetical protein
MKFEIQDVSEAGDATKERVVLRATADADIGRYVLFRGVGGDDETFESGAIGAYWFPDKKVNAGDLVVLYSRDGEESEKTLSGGRKSHFYYWGLDKAQWTKDARAILLEAADWRSQSRPKTK